MTGVESDHDDFLSISETVTVAVDKLLPVFFHTLFTYPNTFVLDPLLESTYHLLSI